MEVVPHGLAELAAAVRRWRHQGERVALCHGCFDMLHYGHVLHLAEAKSIADRLVVTVTPDHYVNKGPSRPVFPAAERLHLLASLRVVNGVAINQWPTAVETLQVLRPDVYVKGSDYVGMDHGGLKEEREAAATLGVEIYYTNTPKWSTTEIVDRILMAQQPQVPVADSPSA
jgi:rfaE bifunctional protein nucleotidyltransferase chain/domain